MPRLLTMLAGKDANGRHGFMFSEGCNNNLVQDSTFSDTSNNGWGGSCRERRRAGRPCYVESRPRRGARAVPRRAVTLCSEESVLPSRGPLN